MPANSDKKLWEKTGFEKQNTNYLGPGSGHECHESGVDGIVGREAHPHLVGEASAVTQRRFIIIEANTQLSC